MQKNDDASGHGNCQVGSWASRWPDAHGRRKRRAGAAGIAEALDDVPLVGGVGVEEADLTVDRDRSERDERTGALRPALVRQILRGRVREGGARAEDQRQAEPPEDRRTTRRLATVALETHRAMGEHRKGHQLQRHATAEAHRRSVATQLSRVNAPGLAPPSARRYALLE